MQIFYWYKTSDGYHMYLECTALTRCRICGRFTIARPEVIIPKIKRR